MTQLEKLQRRAACLAKTLASKSLSENTLREILLRHFRAVAGK